MRHSSPLSEALKSSKLQTGAPINSEAEFADDELPRQAPDAQSLLTKEKRDFF